MSPITSLKQYKLSTQPSKVLNPYCIPGTSEEASLKKKLLKECALTSKLTQNLNILQERAQKRKTESGSSSQKPPRTKSKKCKPVSRRSAKKVPSQEEETQSLQQLIKQQQHKQQELKYNIIKLLVEMKEKQNMLQLQTGMWE